MMNSFTIPNISHLVSIKLDRTNYILWLAQFLPFLRSTDLIGFVDGTKPCLEKFLLNAEKKITNSIDLDFIMYINSTSHWLFSLLFLDSLRLVICGCLLKNARSRSQVLQLKHQFQTTKRWNFSISGYFDKINSIAHILAMACKPIDEEDIILLLLNGVGPTIESVVNSIKTSRGAIILDSVVCVLCSVKAHLHKVQSLNISYCHRSIQE